LYSFFLIVLRQWLQIVYLFIVYLPLMNDLNVLSFLDVGEKRNQQNASLNI